MLDRQNSRTALFMTVISVHAPAALGKWSCSLQLSRKALTGCVYMMHCCWLETSIPEWKEWEKRCFKVGKSERISWCWEDEWEWGSTAHWMNSPSWTHGLRRTFISTHGNIQRASAHWLSDDETEPEEALLRFHCYSLQFWTTEAALLRVPSKLNTNIKLEMKWVRHPQKRKFMKHLKNKMARMKFWRSHT